MICVHLLVVDYEFLASRLVISNLHKETEDDYLKVVEQLYNYVNPKTKAHSPLLSNECYNNIKNNIVKIQAALDYERYVVIYSIVPVFHYNISHSLIDIVIMGMTFLGLKL